MFHRYVDYKGLKKLIKRMVEHEEKGEVVMTSLLESEFFEKLGANLVRPRQ